MPPTKQSAVVPGFRWNGRKLMAARMEAQGYAHKDIAEFCSVTVGTVDEWAQRPQFKDKVMEFVEMEIRELQNKSATRNELEKSMPLIIKWLVGAITNDSDKIDMKERLALAFKVLDRGGILDQALRPQLEVHAQPNQPTVIFDQRQQVMGPGDKQIADELERFRTPPKDIPAIDITPKPTTNGHKPEGDSEESG